MSESEGGFKAGETLGHRYDKLEITRANLQPRRESFSWESKVLERVSQCLAVGFGMARLPSGGVMESFLGLVSFPKRGHRARNVGTQGVTLSTVSNFPVVARGQNEL
jgi:hypothetical protein